MSKLNSKKRIEKEQTQKKSLKKIFIWVGILGIFFLVLIVVSFVNRGADYQSDYQAEYRVETSENDTEVGIDENEETLTVGESMFDKMLESPFVWIIWGVLGYLIIRKTFWRSLY